MKTAHLVAGLVLVILGTLLGIFSLSLVGSTCAEDPLVAQFLNLPTCAQVNNQILAFGAGGFLFLIIGIVVLATGGEKESSAVRRLSDFARPEQAQVRTQKVCPTCGTVYGPEAEFCQKDATPLQLSQ